MNTTDRLAREVAARRARAESEARLQQVSLYWTPEKLAALAEELLKEARRAK